MEIKEHFHHNGLSIAEVISEDLLIRDAADALDLMGDLYYQGYGIIILHRRNVTPSFFDLKNKMAGEILQKFSNYRIRLLIIGDFTDFAGKSLNEFIYESNKGKQVNFLKSTDEALKRFGQE